MLSHVTFTGWDSHTDPTELQTFLEDCPQQSIEIAVLYSASRNVNDEDRYPEPWVAEEILRTAKAAGQRTAVHICGKAARGLLGSTTIAVAGGTLTLPWEASALVTLADRVQVNVPEDFLTAGPEKYRPACDLSRLIGRPVIVQTRDPEAWPEVRHLARDADRMVPFLFDRSGGRGESLMTPRDGEPRSYPTPVPDRMVGYAGGLGPDNVAEFMGRISVPSGRVVERTWIDMETGIREPFPEGTSRPFDRRGEALPAATFVSLTKCQQVVDAVAPWLEGR